MSAQAPAQNSNGTATARGRPFRKGVSGNPGGRPRGLTASIRAHTQDGTTLAAFMLCVFEGKVRGARLRDRMDAATWLADRGFGKPIAAPDPAKTLTPEQADNVVTKVVDSVKRHVKDPSAIMDISADLGRIAQEIFTP